MMGERKFDSDGEISNLGYNNNFLSFLLGGSSGVGWGITILNL